MAYITEMFGIGRHELNLLDRGLEFPRNVAAVERLLKEERKQMRG